MFFKGPFWGAYIRRGLFTEGNLRFKINWASHIVGSKFTVFALFFFLYEGNFPSASPRGGLYFEGRFNRGFFALPVWGAYIWRGLYLEVLIFGILRYAIWTAGNFLWLYIAFSFSFLWKKVARGYAHSSLGKSLKLFHRHVKWNVAWFLTLEFLIVLTCFFFNL